jgi:hypothetical protein
VQIHSNRFGRHGRHISSTDRGGISCNHRNMDKIIQEAAAANGEKLETAVICLRDISCPGRGQGGRKAQPPAVLMLMIVVSNIKCIAQPTLTVYLTEFPTRKAPSAVAAPAALAIAPTLSAASAQPPPPSSPATMSASAVTNAPSPGERGRER